MSSRISISSRDHDEWFRLVSDLPVLDKEWEAKD
jgi:hypothetical protein